MTHTKKQLLKWGQYIKALPEYLKHAKDIIIYCPVFLENTFVAASGQRNIKMGVRSQL